MKTRESGMPEEKIWAGFFEPASVLRQLGLTRACRDLVDFGCGYGTFSVAAARIIQGKVHALDIEADMIRRTATRAKELGLHHIRTEIRDFMAAGSGLPERSMDYAMLFNILHCEAPENLLAEAWRVLVPGGRLGIMHWNNDPGTPRGPPMAIRPEPEQCRDWALQSGFRFSYPELVDLPPYHYGWIFEKR